MDDSTPAATVQFFGAAGTVTGSKHMVTVGDRKVLLDCGLFQGLKALRQRNWEAPPFDPGEIDAVVLSHAHLDHSGYLPLLVRLGYHGPVYCSAATRDLLPILLRDSAYLQEEQAAHANKFGYSRHRPALPLYTMEDVEETLPLLQDQPYQTGFSPAAGVEVVLRCAGHILGSATVELKLDGRREQRLVFSGDLGRWGLPILKDPVEVHHADILIVESTYGDRTHQPDPDGDLARVVQEAAQRGGALIIPAFAVGRTQEVLWRLRQLEDDNRIPVLPVYIDSPMAIDVTGVYLKHPEEHDLEMTDLIDQGRRPLRPKLFSIARTASESKALNDLKGPVIIISASGMAAGGRVLHHLKRRLPDHRTTVLLTGFQAAGTRGRSLQEGAEAVRMHGQEVRVRAQIETVHGLSAHADREELLKWLAGFDEPPAQIFAVHGEEKAGAALVAAIRQRLGWNACIAQDAGQVQVA